MLDNALPRIAEVVLTGGSCAGKTAAIDELAARLRRFRFKVISVPEVATMLIQRRGRDIGAIARADGDAYCRFQREVFLTHRSMRRRAAEEARRIARDGRVVILYDRGELDGLAYHHHDCFDALAAECGTTIDAIRRSYDGVVHMVTAADGAESLYTRANNSARWDTPEEARRSDGLILAAWNGNPHLRVIDNRTDFPGKVQRSLAAILDLLGLPAQMQFELPPPLYDEDEPLELAGGLQLHLAPAGPA